MNINFLKNLPDFKGKRRMARMLLGKSLKVKTDIVVKGKYHLKYKIPNLVENIGFEILINGVYESDTIRFILDCLPENAVFIDVGANIGAIVLPVCRLKEDVFSVAVEASSRVYDYLVNNRQLNGISNVVLINNAVSETDNDELNFYSPESVYGKGSFSPVYTQVHEKVKTITLDTLLKNEKIEKVDFIKVDVEGYEYFVFKGAADILQQKNSPDILFEFLDWAEAALPGQQAGDAQRLLKGYGYTLYELIGSKLIALPEVLTNRSGMLFATKKNL